MNCYVRPSTGWLKPVTAVSGHVDDHVGEEGERFQVSESVLIRNNCESWYMCLSCLSCPVLPVVDWLVSVMARSAVLMSVGFMHPNWLSPYWDGLCRPTFSFSFFF